MNAALPRNRRVARWRSRPAGRQAAISSVVNDLTLGLSAAIVLIDRSAFREGRQNNPTHFEPICALPGSVVGFGLLVSPQSGSLYPEHPGGAGDAAAAFQLARNDLTPGDGQNPLDFIGGRGHRVCQPAAH